MGDRLRATCWHEAAHVLFAMYHRLAWTDVQVTDAEGRKDARVSYSKPVGWTACSCLEVNAAGSAGEALNRGLVPGEPNFSDFVGDLFVNRGSMDDARWMGEYLVKVGIVDGNHKKQIYIAACCAAGCMLLEVKATLAALASRLEQDRHMTREQAYEFLSANACSLFRQWVAL
jgi:hypothetical protein